MRAAALLGARFEREGGPGTVPVAATCPAVAVLGRERSAAPLGAALALRLAAREGAPCALLALGGRLLGPRLPAGAAAARAARALAGRGVPAVASGRLVRAAVGEDPAGLFGRAAAVVPGPAVLVVSAARDARLDEALRHLDAVALVAPEDEPVGVLAALSLGALGPPVEVLSPPRAPLAAAWALGGLGAPASLAGAVQSVLEAVR